ncbi:MAG TPA: CDP-alcohol phosphatidyltransferase family protein [Anaerolineales bacterium]|nr:CDP-alcohol phosphatidyltransferase family protein [Anaerolineales bacterium]
MLSQSLDHDSALTSLRIRWAGLALSLTLIVAAGSAWIYNAWQPGYALRWLALALCLSAYLMWVLWRSLPANHRPEEKCLLPYFGAGNNLTLLRGILLAALAGFLFSPLPPGRLAGLPGLIYTLAATADLFDGYLARRSNQVTQLGERLDMSLDGLGVLIASVLVVQYGQVPAWYLLVGLARYLFLAGIWLRRRLGKPVYELAPRSTRRPFAGAQMGLIAVLMWPIFSPPATYLAAALFALPFLIGFSWDWLTISGSLITRADRSHPEPDVSGITSSSNALETVRWPGRFLADWAPVILRASIVILFALSLAQRIEGYPASIWTALAHLLALVGTILLAFGAAGRVAALAVLFSLGIYQQYSNLTLTDSLAVVAACGLFFLGTGAFSLWTPEKRIIAKRIGEA